MNPTIQTEAGHSTFAARIGVGRADITPPVGIYFRNWGAAEHDTADSIHRPLNVTAMTIQPSAQSSAKNDGDEKIEKPLILVSADMGWWRSLVTFEELQARLLKRLNCEEERLWFSITHTHAAVPLTTAEIDLPGGEMLPAYLKLVEDRTVEAVERALAAAEETYLDWHYGKCQLATARDLPDPDLPNERQLCGYNPANEADDTLLVGRVTKKNGQVLATVVNYACHPTTLAWENRAISPDFIGAMQETVEEATDGALSLFLQGASGELAPREQYVTDLNIIDRHGRQLGYAVLATLADMSPPATTYAYQHVEPSGAPLAVWKYQPQAVRTDFDVVKSAVDLPVKDWPSAEELDQQSRDAEDRYLQERLRRKRDIRQALGDGKTYSMPIWYWRLGEAILIGSMSEGYSELQLNLREQCSEQHLVCLNLLNGSVGYLTPAELYDIDVYQVWQTPFDRGSFETMIEAMGGLIRQRKDVSLTSEPPPKTAMT